jgi:hypothetical protein
MGVARSLNPLGPYTKLRQSGTENPIVHTAPNHDTATWIGPGMHTGSLFMSPLVCCSIFQISLLTSMVYE